MKIIKALTPIVIFTILALYARENYSLLPSTLANAVQYLPVLLLILVISVAIYFNQATILFSVALVSAVYFLIKYNGLESEIKLAVTATFTPILLIVTQLLRNQSIISVRTLPMYIVYILVVLFSLWIIDHQPIWVTEYLFRNWLPEKYFDWSIISQLPLAIYIVVFISLLFNFSKKQNNQSATALIMLIMTFVFLQQRFNSNEATIFMSVIMVLNLTGLLQKSRHMAYIDELTLLPGRRALKEKLQSLLGIYTIAMVDIDFFKKFNDKYGHDTGDDVLRMIAAKLSNVKGAGTAYRYGGEEFTIIFSNKSVEQSLEHLEQLRENIANTKFVVNRRNKTNNNLKKVSVVITVSIGVSDSIDISSANEVLKQADVSLYKAKKKGRNRIS